jgi:hypothetical protein
LTYLFAGGIASALPPSLGIHQEWATSDEVMLRITVVSYGTTMS